MMPDAPYLILKIQHSDAHALFSDVHNLDLNSTTVQHLIFNGGQLYGTGFIKWLANSLDFAIESLEVTLFSGELVIKQWLLKDVELLDYKLKPDQVTEEYLEVISVKLQCKLAVNDGERDILIT